MRQAENRPRKIEYTLFYTITAFFSRGFYKKSGGTDKKVRDAGTLYGDKRDKIRREDTTAQRFLIFPTRFWNSLPSGLTRKKKRDIIKM